jgi:hypothetical protein
MKNKLLGIQSAVSTTYLPNSTTTTATLGRARQKTISGKQVIAPSLARFVDVQTLSGIAPGYSYYVPTQNKLFTIQTSTAAAVSVMMFNFDSTLGDNSYVGRVTLNFANSAATTVTVRGFSVFTDGTNVRIMVSITGSVAINSGIYIAYCPISSFTPSGTSLFAASGAGQNAIYLAQSGDFFGVNATTGFNNTQWGIDNPYLSSDPTINTKLYAMANTVAAPNAMVWDLATTPDVAGQIINGVTSQTTTYANTSPAAYFTSATLPGYSGSSGEPVCLQAGTVAVPTPFATWASGTLQTTSNVYFTRDAQRLHTFTCSPLTTGISANSTYTIAVGLQTLTFIVVTAASVGATSFVATLTLPAQPTNPNTPPASGTLTRTVGTGDATITFSAFVAGNFFFNLSATTGAAAIAPTQALSGFSMLRAFGTSTNQFVARTPIAGLAPALTGTLIQTNVVNYAKPISAPLNPTLNNQECLSIATSSTLYLGRISQIIVLSTTGDTTSGSFNITGMASTVGLAPGMSVIGPAIPAGATIISVGVGSIVISSGANSTTIGSSLVFGTNNWTSLTGANAVGTGIDITTPTITYARYGGLGTSSCVDEFIYYNATTLAAVLKNLQNNVITASFGGTDNTYYELNPNPQVYGSFLATLVGVEFKNGWLFITGGTSGQRGIIAIDTLSSAIFGVSAIISPVEQAVPGTVIKSIGSFEVFDDLTAKPAFWIRSSNLNDATFASANIPTLANPNGWTRIYQKEEINSLVLGPYYQICVTFQSVVTQAQTPAQIVDIEIAYIPPGEMSEKWEGSVDNTSINGASPSYTAFRLKQTDSGTKYFRAYDDNGNLVVSANTSADYLFFDKSTNNGATWTPMASANDYSSTPLTTEIRYKWASPPGVNVTVSLGDS